MYLSTYSEEPFVLLYEYIFQCNIGFFDVFNILNVTFYIGKYILSSIGNAVVKSQHVWGSMILILLVPDAKYFLMLFLAAKFYLFFVCEVIWNMLFRVAIGNHITQVSSMHSLQSRWHLVMKLSHCMASFVP